MHLLAAATVTVLLLPAQVQSVVPTDEVPGHPGLAYGDLMKQAIPDLAPRDDGTWAGQQIPELHDIRGNADQTDLSGGFAFATVDVLRVREGGKSRVLLLTQGGPADNFAELLAVFDDEEPAPKLLDIADVGSDKLVGFRTPPVVSIADRTDLFLIENEHSNSDQSYVDTAMLFLRGGKLTFAADAFTFGERLCTHDMTQTLSIRPLYAGREKYRAISVTVTREVTPSGLVCDDAPKLQAGTRVYRDVFHWDDAKQEFRSDTHALDRLAKENEERF